MHQVAQAEWINNILLTIYNICQTIILCGKYFINRIKYAKQVHRTLLPATYIYGTHRFINQVLDGSEYYLYIRDNSNNHCSCANACAIIVFMCIVDKIQKKKLWHAYREYMAFKTIDLSFVPYNDMVKLVSEGHFTQ